MCILKKSNYSSKQNYGILDIIKLLMSVLVVAIHTHPLEQCKNLMLTNLYDSLTGLAVPFFFICTGFLLGIRCKWGDNRIGDISIIKKHIIKLGKLYIIWNIIYLPLAIYSYVANDKSTFLNILSYFRGFFLIGEHYNSWILWFLLSSIYTLLFIMILMKKNDIFTIVFYGIILYSLGCIINTITGTPDAILGSSVFIKKLLHYLIGNGRIFKGFIYIPIGMMLSQYKFDIKPSMLLFVFSFLLSLFFKLYFDILICLCSIFLFQIFLYLSHRVKIHCIMARKLSTNIYFTHLWVWTIIYSILYHKKTYGIDMFILTVIFSTIVSFVIILLDRAVKKKVIPK